MLETEKRQKTLILEYEGRQEEEHEWEADKMVACFETTQKQMQDHTTAELGALCGHLGRITQWSEWPRGKIVYSRKICLKYRTNNVNKNICSMKTCLLYTSRCV